MAMLSHPVLLLFITVTVYWIANVLRARTGSFLCNPVVLSTVAVILYLKACGIDYDTYHDAAGFIDFWLKPAVVSLAVPLYLNWKIITIRLCSSASPHRCVLRRQASGCCNWRTNCCRRWRLPSAIWRRLSRARRVS